MSRVRLLFPPAPAALFAAILLGASVVSCRPAADPGPEVRLEVRAQPSAAPVGVVLATPFVVEVLDRDDEPLTQAGMTVRAAIQANGGQLGGVVEANVVSGVATFTDLIVIGAANRSVQVGFQLFEAGVANAEAVAISDAFTLTAGPPTALTPQSQVVFNGAPGDAVLPVPSLTVKDAGGNPLTGVPVTFEVIAGEGRITGAAAGTTDAFGAVTVGGWVLGLPGTNQLRASISPTQSVTFSANVTATAGMLRIRAAGQPQGSSVKVRVVKTSAAGTVYDVIHTVVDSLTVTGLQFATYQIIGDSVNVGSRIWLPDASIGGLNVSATSGPSVTLSYREHGRFEITTRGLPGPGVSAILDFQPVSGVGTQLFSLTALNDAVTRGLEVIGTYNLVPRVVNVGGQQWAATPAQQSITLAGGATIAQATVTYAVTTGTLIVDLTGLPPGAAPLIDVSGPGGFRETVFMSVTRTWTGLAPGSYTVVASPITVAGTLFSPTPTTSVGAVTAGNQTRITIAYAQ